MNELTKIIEFFVYTHIDADVYHRTVAHLKNIVAFGGTHENVEFGVIGRPQVKFLKDIAR